MAAAKEPTAPAVPPPSPDEETAIQTTAPAPARPAAPDEATAVLPPPQASPKPADERRAAVLRRLDLLLVGLLLALAFLLGSFAARNTDFWLHLATGRLLARGELAFGADPFAFTSGATPWVNHAWLFDLALYGLYGLLGGPGLVVLQALLLVALAVVLLQMRRPGQSLWLPAAATGLALLAVSTRFFLQPLVVSYLFLGLTLYLLTRAEAQPAAAAPPRSLWLLPPLFALWVNLDAWFFLGPLCVGLWLLGACLQPGMRRGPLARVL